jgi:hypothetical protein
MITAKELARPRGAGEALPKLEQSGSYNHESQQRWGADDAKRKAFLMKSDTTFDGESKDAKDPNELDAEGF